MSEAILPVSDEAPTRLFGCCEYKRLRTKSTNRFRPGSRCCVNLLPMYGEWQQWITTYANWLRPRFED